MTGHEYRGVLDQLHDLSAYVRGSCFANPHEREAVQLSTIIAVATVAVLEIVEANHPQVLTAADWSSVLHFFTRLEEP
jgi:hypothetical protein